MATILRFVTEFQSTCLWFVVIYSLTIQGRDETQELDTIATYACAFQTGYWPYTRCQDLVFNCPNGTVINIYNGLYGRSYRWTRGCNANVSCSSRHNCCAEYKQSQTIQLSQKDKYNISKACNHMPQCKFKVHFSEIFLGLGRNQYISVSYLCISETTTYSSTASLTPNRTKKVAAIDLNVSVSDSWIDRGTSTVVNTSSWSSTTKNDTKSYTTADTKRYLINLPKPTGVPMVAVVVPSVLVPIGVGIGILIFCRKRRKGNDRNVTVDNSYDTLQRNPTDVNNIYGSISYVVEKQSEPDDRRGDFINYKNIPASK